MEREGPGGGKGDEERGGVLQLCVSLLVLKILFSLASAPPTSRPRSSVLIAPQVAIKKCFNIFQSLSDAKKIAREVRLLRQMNHPNITRITTVRWMEKGRDKDTEKRRQIENMQL